MCPKSDDKMKPNTWFGVTARRSNVNIGMIVYSQTGNTRSVAEQLGSKLEAAGHGVTYEAVEVVGQAKPGGEVQFSAAPDPAPYDAVVFGGQVHAFGLSPAMSAYVKQLGSLDGKRVACLITQSFPFKWMGGNRAMRQMMAALESAGANIVGSEIVNWMGSGLEERIANATDALAKIF